MSNKIPQIPKHTVNGATGDSTTSITINGWTITSTSLPISNAPEIDQMQDTLNGLPLPEMPFGNNCVILHHEASGWEYTFNALEALRYVKLGELGDGDGGVKVGHAKAWLQSRLDPTSDSPMPQTSPTKPYDWTYTTTYPGHRTDGGAKSSTIKFSPADPENPSHCIPLAQLARKDPILYYTEVPLFESELDDNGSSRLIVRLRVMPTCFFLLNRFFLRVDNVLFRVFDTRIYHSYTPDPQPTSGDPHIVRETSGWELPYEKLKQRLPLRTDLTPLTDTNWVVQMLTSSFPKSVTQNPKAPGGTGWKGLGTRLECCYLPTPEA
ncbi:hypothetical protein FRB94_008089 [Tulasnella sp. JGI-2019a]|nr:hypothetical protein FRB94_008089 [Tulasnella sp. JGI-2019a]